MTMPNIIDSSRRHIRVVLFVVAAHILCSTSHGETLDAIAAARLDGDIAWYDIRQLGLEGQGWSDTESPFDRLPAKAKGLVRKAVWDLSRHSAGLCVRFVTDASEVYARWTLTSPRLAMNHMPATGVSGLDLYVKTKSGKWRWLAVGRPDKQSSQVRLVTGIPSVDREYLLYLPLYNGVREVEIGLRKTAKLKTSMSRESGLKPIVFYGTSITQGGCASRPGMVHTAILGRRLDAPVINLGFSGNGRMEAAVGELIAELDPSAIVLDCLPNMDALAVTERTEPLVAIIRARHAETPILLVEDRSYTNAFLIESKRLRNETNRAALRVVFEKLVSAGDVNVYYLTGEKLLGDDGEATVDSSHPTDLGFVRQADAFFEVLAPILAKQKTGS